ncbi:hypothetical protein [Phaeocystidibacter luteus]|uniref:Uncharacterized protein n=1 Tax=Phaeocystidibacter luteus TaxID=911197 RepID=A0A6N6RLU7_9FLAO|nr:hypothetical protein [Phaeocystidibacter luteus]KAB2814564.1 hypothetical protein F8C67_02155 [Phaeocystidibacter luteus]
MDEKVKDTEGVDWDQILRYGGQVLGGVFGTNNSQQQMPTPQRNQRNYTGLIFGGLAIVTVVIVAVVLLKRK